MTIKKLLLFAFVLVLSLTKAQTQITKETSTGFDEQKAIKEAIKKGIPKQVMDEYINGERMRYETQNHKHTGEENNPSTSSGRQEEYYNKKVITVDMNTGKMTQTMQTSLCGNSDLSLQNYSNWTGEASDKNAQGTVYPINTYTPGLGMNLNNGTPVYINRDPCQGATYKTDRHVIMTTPIGALTTNLANAYPNGYDPTCKNPSTGFYDLSMTPANGVNSIRLGSCEVNYTGQKLSYAITVNSTNNLFTYQYAVVINDGSHGIGQQPAFTFAMKDINGNVLTNGGNSACVKYDVDATNATTDPTFIKTTSACSNSGAPWTYYRKWRTVTVDLSFYIGSTVYAEFETMDCIYSGHYCYAYISASCGALNATISGFCGGSGTAVMTAPAGFANYQWYGPNNTIPITGATAQSYTAVGATAGQVYSVNCITAAGCTTKLNVTVTASNIYATLASNPSCRGGANGSASVNVSGGTNFSYTWTPNGSSTVLSNTTSVSGIPPGTYSVHIVDNTGNCPNKDTLVTVGVIPPALTATTAQLCGTQIAPQLQVPSGAIAPYSWTMNTSTVVIGTAGTLAYSNSVSPTDYFIVTYKDPTTGCLDSLKTTFNQVNINFNPISSPPCTGGQTGSIILNGSSNNTYANYSYGVNVVPSQAGFPITYPTATTNTVNINSAGAGTYTITITGVGNPSCAYTHTVTLSPTGIPPATLDTLKGCALDNIVLSPGGGPGHSWTTGTSTVVLATTGSYTVTGVTNGVTYTDTIRNAAGCKSVYKVLLKVRSFNSNLISPEGIRCHDDSTGKLKTTATQEINGPLGTPYTFTWQYPAPYTSPATVIAGTGVPQSSTVNTLHPGTYTVVIKSGNCINTFTYNFTNPALLNTDTINGFYCPKDSLALLIATQLGAPKYIWLYPATISPYNHIPLTATQNPWYNNDSIWVPTGNVNNYWVAYLDGGCKDTAKILIRFPSLHALRPDTTVNIFTPNGDNRNDFFYPFYSKGFTQYEINKQTDVFEMYIYNRWGKLVYTTNEYSKPWNGNDQSGSPQDDGTYFYILKYKSNCATKADIVEKKGFVQLLR